MTRLSIIIPCLGRVESCEDTLVSVLQHRPASCDVTVLHTHPYTDPYGVGNEVNFVRLPKRTPRTTLVTTGIAATSGEIVHLLSPGVTVTEGWTDAAAGHFEDRTVGAVSPLINRSDRGLPAVTGLAYSAGGRRLEVTETDAAEVLGPSGRAAFYRREALAPFIETMASAGDAFFDLEAALSLREVGWRTELETTCCVFDVGGSPVEKASFANGLAAERVYRRHRPARGTLHSTAAHAWMILCEDVLRLYSPAVVLRLLGRVTAALQQGDVARYQLLVDSAAEARSVVKREAAVIPFPAAGTTRSSDRGTVQPGYRRAA